MKKNKQNYQKHKSLYKYLCLLLIVPFLSFSQLDPIKGKTIRMIKRNAKNFSIDGGNGGRDGQNVYLWRKDKNQKNQQWIEVDHGDGYFSYIKKGTRFAIDAGRGGGRRQNVYLWTYDKNNYNQHWKKVRVASGFFRLQKRGNPRFSIDGDNGGTEGQNVHLFFSNDNNKNQHWKFITVPKKSSQSKEKINLVENIETNEISIFPNPIKDVISIKLDASIKDAKGSIYSPLGRKKAEIDLSTGINTFNKTALNLSAGIYLIHIKSNNGLTTKKIVIE